MDINYILGREQTSIHNAEFAAHAGARASHRGLAKAYGQLLADSVFPHRQPITQHVQAMREECQSIAEEVPGTHPHMVRVDTPVGRDAERLEIGERRLAADFADGRVSPKAFQTRSRFLRQERAQVRPTLREAAPPGARSNMTPGAMLLGVG